MTDPRDVFDSALQAAKFRVGLGGADPELQALVSASEKLRAELDELDHLFELQWRRSREAEARWRAEDPEARALTSPDLGELLRWLMADADQARNR